MARAPACFSTDSSVALELYSPFRRLVSGFGVKWSLIACAILFRGISTYGGPFLFMVFVVGALTAAFYGWTPLYLPELFPTRMRATGQGLAYNAGRIIAAVGTLQMGALMKEFDGSYARAGSVISLIYILGMIVIWFAPETKDRPLPE